MSKGNTFENDFQKLVFNATPIANLADNAASAPLTNLEVSLHTADPGEAGVQTTNECAYPGYARVPVPRTSGGWVVTTNNVSPAANIDFPAVASAAAEIATHIGIGSAHSGAGKLMYSGPLVPVINIGQVGMTPRVTSGTSILED